MRRKIGAARARVCSMSMTAWVCGSTFGSIRAGDGLLDAATVSPVGVTVAESSGAVRTPQQEDAVPRDAA